MSPDFQDALAEVKDRSEWAYDLIIFQIERQAKEITKLREQLAEAHRMLTKAVQLMPEYWDPAIQQGAHEVMQYWDKIQEW